MQEQPFTTSSNTVFVPKGLQKIAGGGAEAKPPEPLPTFSPALKGREKILPPFQGWRDSTPVTGGSASAPPPANLCGASSTKREANTVASHIQKQTDPLLSLTQVALLRTFVLVLLLIASIVSLSCRRAPAEITGLWQGVIFLSEQEGDEVPFKIEFKQDGTQVTGTLINGDERLNSTSGSWDGKKLKLRFDFYDGELTAALVRKEIIGEFKRQSAKKILTRRLKLWRQGPNVNPPDASGKNVSGEWLLRVGEGENQRTWRASFRHNGSEVVGTIIPLSGDWGVMTGSFYDGKLFLARFDGINARTFRAVLRDDGKLEGAVDFGLPNSRTRKVIAEKIEAAGSGAQTPDPHTVTKVKNPAEPFRYECLDLSGQTVAATAERFKNKVTIYSITGSWCPNCHDEVKALNELYDKYHAQGLEVVLLGFEYTGEVKRDSEQLRIFEKRHGVKYPILLCGTTEDGQVQQKLPQLDGFSAYPTTIYVGRDGRVKKIHAGFEGPATGERHTRLKKEMDELVRELLAGSDG